MKKVTLVIGAVALIFAASTSTAFAFSRHSSNDITVSNHNGAFVMNNANVSANTGANTANGGNGGNGGAAYSFSGNANAGDGDNGGNAGTIRTGNASAGSSVLNQVNYNDTVVRTTCGCEGDITVRNSNHAFVMNNAALASNSGANTANGGRGGNGGNASTSGWFWFWNNQGNHTANGGNGDNGGNGGTITTGTASASSIVGNIVNTNVSRVVRTGAPVVE